MSEITKKPLGILFDLDGVLLDSEGQYSIFWESMDKEYPTGIEGFADYIKGSNLKRILDHFENDEVRQDILNKLLDFERHMKYEFFPGALEFVKQLHDAEIPIAIVTSSDSKKMQALYSQHPEFSTMFDNIVTGDIVTKAKPDPECFLLGAKMLDVDIRDCIVFEDSINGLTAARQSGARVIGLATTLSAEAINPLCDMTINAVSELDLEKVLEYSKKS